MAEQHFYGEGTIRHGNSGEDVLGLLVPPAWHADALCKEDHPGVSWFPERGESLEAAKAVCRRCLVQSECRAVAVADPDLHGVWGATSGKERRKIRAEAGTLPRRICSWCGTWFYRAAGGASDQRANCGGAECRRASGRERRQRNRAKAG